MVKVDRTTTGRQGRKPLGLGVGAKDSWTLTDWFESIYLRQAGPDKYDKLFSGEIAFTDAERPRRSRP